MSSKAHKRSNKRKSIHIKVKGTKLTPQQIKYLRKVIRARRNRGKNQKKQPANNQTQKKEETTPTTTPTTDQATTQTPEAPKDTKQDNEKSSKATKASNKTKAAKNNTTKSTGIRFNPLTTLSKVSAALAGKDPAAAAAKGWMEQLRGIGETARWFAMSNTNHKRALKGLVNNNTSRLAGTGMSASNDVINRWKNTRMKNRLDYTPYLQDVILDATKRQTEAIEKQNRYLKEQREKYERIGGAPVSDLKPNEFGKTVDPLTGTYIETIAYKPFQYVRSNNRELTKKEKEDVYTQYLQRAKFNRKHHLKEMERLKHKVDDPNALIEEQINNISDEYKNLVKYETHDFVSHPEEIIFKEKENQKRWQQFSTTMNTAIKAAADVARLATDKLNPIGSITDLIKSKLKNVPGKDEIAEEADKLQQHLINENNKMVEKYENEANKIIDFVKKNKDMVNKAIESGEFANYQAIAIPDMTLAEALADDRTLDSFAAAFDTSYNTARRLETISNQLGKDPSWIKKYLVKAKEGAIAAGSAALGAVKGAWNKVTGTDIGKSVGDTINQFLTGKSDDDIAAIKFERGDHFEDVWKHDAQTDLAELSLKDILTNLKKRKDFEAMKKLNMRDVVGMNELGIDFRLKNEFIQSPILKQAHKAFIKGDEVEKSKLKLLGINSTDDLRKRKNDLYEYLLLRGTGTEELNELFDKYAGLSQREYEKKVLEPIIQLKQARNIDTTESIANKLMKIASVYKGAEDLDKGLIESRLKLFDSREGIDAIANNNRVRDLIKDVFKYENRAETNPRENKMKNKLIAQLTALMSQDGFMSYEEEKELISKDNLGNAFFKHITNDGSIFDAKNLKDDDDITSAYNQINNFIDYRRHYMRANNKVATQKTFNEVATGNTGQNFLAKTPGMKFNDIDDIVSRTVYNDDEEVNSRKYGTPEQQYEKSKRQAHFRAALEENPTKMITIMNQIEDPKAIKLSMLDEMSKKAKEINNQQELIEYGRSVNQKIGIIKGKPYINNYQYLNDGDIQYKEPYQFYKALEYQHILRPNKDNQKQDISKLPMNEIVKQDGRYLLKTKNEIGDTLATEINPNKREQYLVAYFENDNPQTLSSRVNEQDREISEKGRKIVHKFMNNPKGLNEANIQRISDDSFLKIASTHEFSHETEFNRPQLTTSTEQKYEDPYEQPQLTITMTNFGNKFYDPSFMETSMPTTYEMAYDYKPELVLANTGTHEEQYKSPKFTHTRNSTDIVSPKAALSISNANTALFQQPIPIPILETQESLSYERPKVMKYKRAPHKG